MWSTIVFLAILPAFVYPFQCYRCYGNSFCNGGTSDSGFLNATHIDRCADVITSTNETRFGCLTATIFEARETHTLRMCVTNATVYCQLLENALFPNNSARSGNQFSCRTCSTPLCNTHTLSSGANTGIFSLTLLVLGLLAKYF